MPNHLTAGASYDGGSTEFTASTLLGGLSLDRGFFGPGIVVVPADGSITPVRVHAFNNYYGLYVTDTIGYHTPPVGHGVGPFQLGADHAAMTRSALTSTASHSYNRLNPAVGLTYKILPT